MAEHLYSTEHSAGHSAGPGSGRAADRSEAVRSGTAAGRAGPWASIIFTHDVFSQARAWTEQTRTYLLELIRQIANLSYIVQQDFAAGGGQGAGTWRVGNASCSKLLQAFAPRGAEV